MTHVVYTPSPTIARFLRSDADVKAVMGPLGSGKSVGCVMEILRRAQAQEPSPDGVRKTRFAVVRNTYIQLRDTTIKTWLDWVPDGKAGVYKQAKHEFHMRFPLSDGTVVESEILFRALDKPEQERNLLSLELTGAWLNEFREIPFRIFTAMLGRVGRFPSMRDGGPTWHGIIMDTNPFSTESPWYKLLVEYRDPEELAELLGVDIEDLPKIEFFKQPGGLSPKAENIENLPGGRQYYIRMMAAAKMEGRDENWIRAHVHGEFVHVAHGQPVYADSFSSDQHVAPGALEHNPDWPVLVGVDFGLLNPAAVFAQLDPSGVFLIQDEITDVINKDISEFLDILERRLVERYGQHPRQLGFFGDPAGNIRSIINKQSAVDIVRSRGYVFYDGPQDLETRIGAVKLALRTKVGQTFGILVDPRCRKLIQGFLGGYQFRRMKTREERYDEKPDKNEYSHVHDALQYLVGWFNAPRLQGLPGRSLPEMTNMGKSVKMKQKVVRAEDINIW